jgi:hypothetical protein
MEWQLHSNLAWITCIDVLDDVLETTVELATSRKVPLGGLSIGLSVDLRGLCGYPKRGRLWQQL